MSRYLQVNFEKNCSHKFRLGRQITDSMSKVLSEVLKANESYVAGFGDKGSLPLPPARSFAILTCMDARLDPAKYAGLAEGDAHVIRNAGGRASDDAIRSLVISHKLLGTNEWFVIHHTDCGMELFTDDIIGDLLSKSLDTAVIDASGWHESSTAKGPGSSDGKYVKWLTIPNCGHSHENHRSAVLEDVQRIRNSSLVPKYVAIYGYVYDVKTGKLVEVPEATQAGKPNIVIDRAAA
jgi:carbonic anhydrase